MKLPEHIILTVSSLLEPYGVNFKELIDFGSCSNDKRYMTAKQASVYCGLKPKTLRDKALAGEIKSIRLGNHERSRVLILKSDLDNWLERFSVSNKKHA